MRYDYNALYAETGNALSAPTPEIVDFFQVLPAGALRVLDLSPAGIRDLTEVAEAETLPITGVVADLQDFTPKGAFDVVLIDRTLHMLDRSPRLDVLARMLGHMKPGGWLVIADEPLNMAGFRAVPVKHVQDWRITRPKSGLLVAQMLGNE